MYRACNQFNGSVVSSTRYACARRENISRARQHNTHRIGAHSLKSMLYYICILYIMWMCVMLIGCVRRNDDTLYLFNSHVMA